MLLVNSEEYYLYIIKNETNVPWTEPLQQAEYNKTKVMQDRFVIKKIQDWNNDSGVCG